MAAYSWLTKTAAIAALQGRLNQSSFWLSTELWGKITEALRHWNGLCEQWNQTLAVTNANGQWINTGTLAGSPRLRSVTDMDLYSSMCYTLLEPQLSAGSWAGSTQFTLQQLQWSLLKRCQETIQQSSCNLSLLPSINATPGVRTAYVLPDTALEARRNRFFQLVLSTAATGGAGASQVIVASATGVQNGQVISGTGLQAGTFVTGVSGISVNLSLPTSGAVAGTVQFFQPYLLTREDPLSFQSFEPSHLQTVGTPQSWAVVGEPPLSFWVDIAPNTPGYFEMLALNAGPTFAPPAASLLGLPDDWSMVPMYGALADVLAQEAESTDMQRSAYCLERYNDMRAMMQQSNWLLQAPANGVVTPVTALADMDTLGVNWQQSLRNLPAIIVAGMDFFAPVPGSQSLAVTVVGNAPLLDSTGVYVQVSRDDWQSILDYAQHVAMLKTNDWSSSMSLLQSFYRAVATRNRRWETYGIFAKYLHLEGKKQERVQPKEMAVAS